MTRTPFIHIAILAAFLTSTLGPFPAARADEFHLPAPGVMVHLSPEFNPPVLKGIKVHPDNPFRFDFILDRGDAQGNLKQEAAKLIKYFLASLTIPEKDLWVNLSPYEKDRIIPQSFGLTGMGRDLLAEDYMLKQITASLIYPEDDIGRKFWKRIYKEAEEKYGTTSIPVNTFNKVWIVPEKAVVYENAKAGTAYVVASRLKVMLDQDYLSMSKHAPAPDINRLGSQIIREIVIPELTREVNEDKNFIQLRQVYNSLILAAWYKKKIKDSILSRVYSNKNKVAGVNIDDPREKEKIYQQYLKAFKKGVYNYIKEETDPLTGQDISRKYFSGGVDFAMNGSTSMNGLEGLIKETGDPTAILGDKNDSEVDIVITPLARKLSADHAMLGGLFKPFVRIDAHSLLLPGGAVLLSDLDSSKVPNPIMSNKVIEEDSRGKVWLTGSGGWDIDNTPFWAIDDIFGIMRRIEKLDRERKDKSVPIVILDWGCGKGAALIGLLHDLQRRERQGEGIANVVLYGFSDEFYPDWKKAPRGINFIWGTANHLKEHLERHLHGVNLIFSHEGLEHIFGNNDLFKRHLADLYDLLDPQSGVLLIADTPHHKGENVPYAQSVMHSKEISDGRFVIKFIEQSPTSHRFASEWRPVVSDKAQLTSAVDLIPIQERTALLEEQIRLTMKENGHENRIEEIRFSDNKLLDPMLFNKLAQALKEREIIEINLNGVRKGSYPFLRELFLEIGFYIANKTHWEKNYAPEAFSIWELLKNAFVHGNHLDNALPIYITVDNQRKLLEVFDLNLKSLGKEPDKEVMDASKYILWGRRKGVAEIESSKFNYTLTDMTVGHGIVGKMATIELIGKPGDSDHAMSAHLIKFNDFVKGLFKDPGRIDLSSNSDALVFHLNEAATYEDITFYLDLLLTEVINNALQEQKEGKIKVTVQGDRILVKNQGSIPWGKVLDKYYGLINKNDLYVSYKKDGTVEDLVREEAIGKEHKDIYKKAEKGLIDGLFKTSAGRITLLFARRRISFAEGKEAATNGGMGMSVAMGLLRARLGGSLKLADDGQRSGEVAFEIKFSKRSPFTLIDQTMSPSLSRNGGIDLTADRTPLEIQNSGQGIKFHLDPAQLQQLQDAPGFVPVIINIQPVNDLRQFLGLTN